MKIVSFDFVRPYDNNSLVCVSSIHCFNSYQVIVINNFEKPVAMDKVLFIFVILAVANVALCQNTSESDPSNSTELDEGLCLFVCVFENIVMH